MLQVMQLVGFHERTLESYLRAVTKLALYYKKCPDQLSEVDVRNHFLMLRDGKNFGPSTPKVVYCAIRYSILRLASAIGSL